jgi:hypothetical protein
MDPQKFENRNEFYQERKTHRVQAIESEMMKNCRFQPQIFSKDAKPSMNTQPVRTKSSKRPKTDEVPKSNTSMNHGNPLPPLDTHQTPYFSLGTNNQRADTATIYSEHEMNTLFDDAYVDEPYHDN